jgi:hypothetical protein
MSHFITLLLISSAFTACMTAHDKEIWSQSKALMSVGPTQAISEDKKDPIGEKGPIVSDASEDKNDEKKEDKAATR